MYLELCVWFSSCSEICYPALRGYDVILHGDHSSLIAFGHADINRSSATTDNPILKVSITSFLLIVSISISLHDCPQHATRDHFGCAMKTKCIIFLWYRSSLSHTEVSYLVTMRVEEREKLDLTCSFVITSVKAGSLILIPVDRSTLGIRSSSWSRFWSS